MLSTNANEPALSSGPFAWKSTPSVIPRQKWTGHELSSSAVPASPQMAYIGGCTHTHAAGTPPLLGTRPNQRSKAGFVQLMAAALQPGPGNEGTREERKSGKEGRTAEAENVVYF